MIIGNFFRDSLTSFILVDTNAWYSYYYIDDVCVSIDSNTCYSPSHVGLENIKPENNDIKISYTNDNIILTKSSKDEITTTIKITDLLGRELYKEMLIGIETKINVSKWSAGVYFYCLTPTLSHGEEVSVRGKFVIQK